MIIPYKFGKILSKLPKDKTQLGKVELALIDDLKSEIDKIEKDMPDTLFKNAQKEYDLYIKLLNEAVEARAKSDKQAKTSLSVRNFAKEEVAKVKQLIKNADVKANDASQAMKALGINVDIPEINKLNQLKQQANNFDFSYEDDLPF